MSDNTPYGTLTVQGVDVSTTSDLNLDTGRTQMPGVRLWGHRINLSGEDGIECEECEMREEIPEILQMSSGFREVVYKLYILGKFKNTRCEPEFETDQSVLHDNVTNVGYDPSKVHWADNGTQTKQKFQLDDGYVIAGGGTIYESTSDQYYAGDMLTDKEWLQLHRESQTGTTQISDMSDSFSSLSDTSSATNASVQMDADVDDKSVKEKLAAALCEKAGIS